MRRRAPWILSLLLFAGAGLLAYYGLWKRDWYRVILEGHRQRMELDDRLCVELQPDRFQLFEVEARVLGVTHRSARAGRTIKKEVQKYNYARKRWEKATETSYEPSVDEKWNIEVEFAADGTSRKQSVPSASSPDSAWSEIQIPKSKGKIEAGDTVRLQYNPALNEVHPKSDWEGIRRERLQLASTGLSKQFYEQDRARGPETWMFWLAGAAGATRVAVLGLGLLKRRPGKNLDGPR